MSALRWLVLWRHGEAEQAAGLPDRERRLTAHGRAQARAAAHQIAALDPMPTLLLHSSAPRAAETAAIGAAVLALPGTAQRPLDELYLASPATLRAVLARHGADEVCVLLVGHNPALSEFGTALDPRLAGQALATAGWWRVSLEN